MTNIIAQVIAVLFLVESDGRLNPPNGDGGRAVGPFQMWEVAVDEANRLAKCERWSYNDRQDYSRSVEMAETILSFHYRRGTTNVVDLACKWHTPYGQQSPRYRQRVVEKRQQLRNKHRDN